MKILTAEQMREADRRAIASGIPSVVLMENAGCRVVEFLERRYAPLERQRIVVVCGKGNNGGDGLVIARQLWMRFRPAALDVLLAHAPEEFQGDAATNWQYLQALGVAWTREVAGRMRAATLIVDALLGTGLRGPATGRAAELIHEMNGGFPAATVVSVDVPSGLHPEGECVHAAHTVTFAALKTELALPPGCNRCGEVVVAPIGIPSAFIDRNDALWLEMVEPKHFAKLLAPRARDAHKGTFGHVQVIGGALGKGGAAAMAGAAALRAGAGLVTVATDPRERAAITMRMPELMTADWADDLSGRDVLAIGPGLGRAPEAESLALRLFDHAKLPAVFDADALNALPLEAINVSGQVRVLTPHPGEMARLTGFDVAAIQAERVAIAREYARQRELIVVLKGQRTVTAVPDGRAFVNPTGSPAMAKGGSGDILTGLIAGLLAQFPSAPVEAVIAAVWLHGRAGELGVAEYGEQCLTATDLLRFLPAAIADARS